MSIVNNINYVGNFVDFYLENCVKPGDTVVDGTIGRGNDTIKLAKLVGPTGKIYGFDIQKEAIDYTEEALKSHGYNLNNIKLILDDHSRVLDHIDERCDLGIMNLGYLPGSDKEITTKSESTIKFIKDFSSILKSKGKLLITMYPGHSEGQTERDKLLEFLSTLDQNKYNIFHINFINQINNPPELIVMERKND